MTAVVDLWGWQLFWLVGWLVGTDSGWDRVHVVFPAAAAHAPFPWWMTHPTTTPPAYLSLPTCLPLSAFAFVFATHMPACLPLAFTHFVHTPPACTPTPPHTHHHAPHLPACHTPAPPHPTTAALPAPHTCLCHTHTPPPHCLPFLLPPHTFPTHTTCLPTTHLPPPTCLPLPCPAHPLTAAYLPHTTHHHTTLPAHTTFPPPALLPCPTPPTCLCHPLPPSHSSLNSIPYPLPFHSPSFSGSDPLSHLTLTFICALCLVPFACLPLPCILPFICTLCLAMGGHCGIDLRSLPPPGGVSLYLPIYLGPEGKFCRHGGTHTRACHALQMRRMDGGRPASPLLPYRLA